MKQPDGLIWSLFRCFLFFTVVLLIYLLLSCIVCSLSYLSRVGRIGISYSKVRVPTQSWPLRTQRLLFHINNIPIYLTLFRFPVLASPLIFSENHHILKECNNISIHYTYRLRTRKDHEYLTLKFSTSAYKIAHNQSILTKHVMLLFYSHICNVLIKENLK